MKRSLRNLARRYQAALQAHLREGGRESLDAARGFGREALAAGFRVRDLIELHERTLVDVALPACPPRQRARLIRRASAFFVRSITLTDPSPREKAGAVPGRVLIETLCRRTLEVAASNRDLALEIARRRMLEERLRRSEEHQAELLEQSRRLQEQSRGLARKVLSAQEDERCRISRDLHDVIAQTLTGITLRLAALRTAAAASNKGLQSRIISTQRLVEHSVGLVHRFALELRPAALDDLGLIPALHSYLRTFTRETGIRARLTAHADIEKLSAVARTVLYRVAQEALVNARRHSGASRVEVTIRREAAGICMRIADNGRSFPVDQVLSARGGRHLGLLGMRERVEMIGGSLVLESTPGRGTTVEARLPRLRQRRGRGKVPGTGRPGQKQGSP